MIRSRSEGKIILLMWLAFIGLAGWGVTSNGTIVTDFSIFLPDGATKQDRLVLFLLAEGNGSRTMLVSIDGDSTEALVRINKRMAKELKASGRFGQILNGDVGLLRDDESFFYKNRYLLSPAINEESFTATGLRESLEIQIKRLASTRGIFEKRYFARDPSREFLRIVKNLSYGNRLQRHGGVFFSMDRRMRTFFVTQSRSHPFVLGPLEHDLALIRKEFEKYKGGKMTLYVTGIPVFALKTRNLIRQEAWLFSLVGSILVTAFLLWVCPSVSLLFLIAVPLASGVLAAVTVVIFVFGSIHGITLSFGVALMGIGVDYPIHAVFPSANAPNHIGAHLQRIWPTLRMAALSTCVGYLAMLFAGFEGLVHLAIFAVTGLIGTAIATRWVVPSLVLISSKFRPTAVRAFRFEIFFEKVRSVKWASVAVLAIGSTYLIIADDSLWNDDISRLSPISAQQKLRDRQLRREMGVPDVRYLGVVWGKSTEEVLVRSEQLVPVLDDLVSRGRLAGYEMAAKLLPSRKKQAYRRKSLPNEETLRRNLQVALKGFPFKENVFRGFLEDVQKSKAASEITLETLPSNALRLRIEPLLFRFGESWVGIIQFRNPNNIESLQKELTQFLATDFQFLDVKKQTTKMLEHFRSEAIRWIWVGSIFLIISIYLLLRNWETLVRVVVPVIASLVATIIIVARIEGGLTVFHLISFLLIAGLGLDYSLFFQCHFDSNQERTHTLRTILVCCGTTFLAFSVLAFSNILVLHAIGLSVAIGVPISLLFTAMWTQSGAVEKL